MCWGHLRQGQCTHCLLDGTWGYLGPPGWHLGLSGATRVTKEIVGSSQVLTIHLICGSSLTLSIQTPNIYLFRYLQVHTAFTAIKPKFATVFVKNLLAKLRVETHDTMLGHAHAHSLVKYVNKRWALH